MTYSGLVSGYLFCLKKNDLFNGKGIYHDNSTGNKYDGNWINNKKEGNGTEYWPNGDYYIGGWKNMKKNGYGIYTWQNGDIYAGYWLNDLFNGSGIYHDNSTGNKYSGDWKDGKKKRIPTKW